MGNVSSLPYHNYVVSEHSFFLFLFSLSTFILIALLHSRGNGFFYALGGGIEGGFAL